MDKKLQKLILRIIKENDGIFEWKLILSKTQRNYWKDNYPIKSDKIIKHQLDLLEKEDKLIRVDALPEINFILTPKGHAVFDPWYKKLWNFIAYDKNNIPVFLSILISIGSLIVSIYALNK